jgi:hypothetical protein
MLQQMAEKIPGLNAQELIQEFQAEMQRGKDQLIEDVGSILKEGDEIELLTDKTEVLAISSSSSSSKPAPSQDEFCAMM